MFVRIFWSKSVNFVLPGRRSRCNCSYAIFTVYFDSILTVLPGIKIGKTPSGSKTKENAKWFNYSGYSPKAQVRVYRLDRIRFTETLSVPSQAISLSVVSSGLAFLYVFNAY